MMIIHQLQYYHANVIASVNVKEIRFPFICSDISEVVILGSSGGVVCLIYFFNCRRIPCIWNPYTEEYKLVPISTILYPFQQYVDVRANGFCHDYKTDDFIFVSISGSTLHPLNYDGSVVSIYSLKSNSWKQLLIPNEFPFQFGNHTTPGVFFSGSLHWFAKTVLAPYSEVLIAFDVEKGFAQEIPQPQSLVDADDKYMDVFDGCLCMLCSTKVNGFDVWKVHDYGVPESWIKIWNIPRVEMIDESMFQYLRRIKCLKDDQAIRDWVLLRLQEI
ncbi:F-box protein At4g22390-like [Papaver somniferum]|uniref:F-box protein At4g22390-like n=1 Tax=Papaver somniferum TaxID=3469 RepID=UPI000E6FFA98|nr:F-box protein At4g22390-like [Papaver somniferum]